MNLKELNEYVGHVHSPKLSFSGLLTSSYDYFSVYVRLQRVGTGFNLRGITLSYVPQGLTSTPHFFHKIVATCPLTFL